MKGPESTELTEVTEGSDLISEQKIYAQLKLRSQYSWVYQQLVTLMLKIDTIFKPFENKITDSEYAYKLDKVAENFLNQVNEYAKCLVTIRNSMQLINAQLAINSKEKLVSEDSESVTPDLKKLKELIQQPQLPIEPLLWGNIAIMWRRCWHALGAAAHAYDNCVEAQARIYQKAIFDHTQEIESSGDATAKILNPRNLKTKHLREQIVALRNSINEYKKYSGETPSFWGKKGIDPKTNKEYPKEPNTFDFVVYLAVFLTEIAEEKRVQIAHSQSLGIHSWEEIFSQLDAWNGRATTEKSDILTQIDENKKSDIEKGKLVIAQYIENTSFYKLNERLKSKEDKVYDYCYTAVAGSAPLESIIAKLQDFHDYFGLQNIKVSTGFNYLGSIIMELTIVLSSLKEYAGKADKIAENSQKFIDEYNLKLRNLQSESAIKQRRQEIINTLQKLAEIFVPVIIMDRLSTPKKIVTACTTAELARRDGLDNQWSDMVFSMLEIEEGKYAWSEKIKNLSIAVGISQSIPTNLLPMRIVFVQLLEKNINVVGQAIDPMEENFKRLRSRPQINTLIFRDLLTQWQTEAKSMIIHIEGVGDLVTTPLYRVQEAITLFNGRFKGGLFPGSIEGSYAQVKLYTQWLADYLKKLTSKSYSVSDIMKALSIWVEQINAEIFNKFSEDPFLILGITVSESKPLKEAKQIENILKLKSYLMARQDEKSVESTLVYPSDKLYIDLTHIYKYIYRSSKYGVRLNDLISKRLTELLNATEGVQNVVFLLLLYVYEARGAINFEGDLFLYKKIILACQGKSLVEKRFNLTKIISEQSIELLRKNSPKKEPPDIFLAPLITVAEKLYILHDKMHEALLDSYETKMEFSELNGQMTQVKKELQVGIRSISSSLPSSPSSLRALFDLWRNTLYSKVNISETELKTSHLDVEFKRSSKGKGTVSGEFKVINMKLWPSICRHFLPLLSFEELAKGILLRLGLKTASSTPSPLTQTRVSLPSKQKTSLLDTLDDKTALELDYTEDVDSGTLVEYLKLGVESNPVGKASITKLVLSRAQVFLQVWFDPALNMVKESLQTCVLTEMKQHILSAAKRAVLNFALEAPSHILMNAHQGSTSMHFYRFQYHPTRTSIWEASFMALQIIADEKQPFFDNIPHLAALQLKIAGDQFGQGNIQDTPFDEVLRRMAAELKINICLYQAPAPELVSDKIDGEEEEDSKSIFKLSSVKLRKFEESGAIQFIYLYRDHQGYCYPLLPTAELVQKPEQILRLQKLPATVFSTAPVELSYSRSSSSSSSSCSSYSISMFSSATASISSDSSLESLSLSSSTSSASGGR